MNIASPLDIAHLERRYDRSDKPVEKTSSYPAPDIGGCVSQKIRIARNVGKQKEAILCRHDFRTSIWVDGAGTCFGTI
jgi:hypothetical protein